MRRGHPSCTTTVFCRNLFVLWIIVAFLVLSSPPSSSRREVPTRARPLRRTAAPVPSESPTHVPPPAPATVPLVYVWLTDTLEPYAAETTRHSARYAPVVLLSAAVLSPELQSHPNITSRPLRNYESQGLERFRALYKPWGLREPWERQNMERFFYLHAWMRSEGVSKAMYFDSDAALIAPVPTLSAECDACVDVSGGGEDMRHSTYFWAVWAGSSVLSVDVLGDLLEFTLATYASPAALAVLEEKRSKAPYVCDMTLWYLFVAASSPKFRARWGADADVQRLPSVSREWRFCDSDAELHMDHRQGHRLTPTWRTSLNSLHFQGEAKGDAAGVLAYLANTKAVDPFDYLVILVPVGGGFDPRLFRDTWVPSCRATVAFVGECAGCDWAVSAEAERQAASGQWLKVREMLMDAPRRYPDAKWFMKIDGDTYVVPSRLESFMAKELRDWTRARYVGYNVTGVLGEYAQGGAGYILSRPALDGLFSKPECGARQNAHDYLRRDFEDLNLGWCLKRNGVALEARDVFMEATIETRVKEMHDTPEDATARFQRAVALHYYKSREAYLELHRRVSAGRDGRTL